MEPKVTLVSWSSYPIETIYYLWEASRTNDPIEVPAILAEKAKSLPVLRARMREIFEKVVASGIPVAENLWFVFLLEGVSVSFREQMVRHRIGVKVGERIGSDLAPDIHDSTWWSQSMRVMNMGKFYDDKMFRIPETIKQNGHAFQTYTLMMRQIQDAYNELVEEGIPNEDAREVIPLGAQHRISWGLNLAAIQHIVSKRSCWLLQLGLWEPIIKGIVRELATKVDEVFYKLATPPCIKAEKWAGCPFKLDNEKRLKGEDPLPTCSLFLDHEGLVFQPRSQTEMAHFLGMMNDYKEFWGRNPQNGELLK